MAGNDVIRAKPLVFTIVISVKAAKSIAVVPV